MVEWNYTIFFFSLQFSFILLRLRRTASTTTTTTTTKHVVRACSTARPRGSLYASPSHLQQQQSRTSCMRPFSLLRALRQSLLYYFLSFRFGSLYEACAIDLVMGDELVIEVAGGGGGGYSLYVHIIIRFESRANKKKYIYMMCVFVFVCV